VVRWCVQRTGWRGGSTVVFLARQGQNRLFICHFVLPCPVRTRVATGEAPSGTFLQRRRRRGSKAPLYTSLVPHPQTLSSLIPLLSFHPRSWRRTERRSGETLATHERKRKQKVSSKDDCALPSLGGDLLYPNDAEIGGHEELELHRQRNIWSPTRPRP
jgi:hypothetical protein